MTLFKSLLIISGCRAKCSFFVRLLGGLNNLYRFTSKCSTFELAGPGCTLSCRYTICFLFICLVCEEKDKKGKKGIRFYFLIDKKEIRFSLIFDLFLANETFQISVISFQIRKETRKYLKYD